MTEYALVGKKYSGQDRAWRAVSSRLMNTISVLTVVSKVLFTVGVVISIFLYRGV